MYHPTTRVLTVLELLQTYQRLSGPEIAARLELNIRTVRRYITMLQDLGIPIEAERGRYGAYTLRPGFKLPPLMFTEDEALALTLGLLVGRRLGLSAAAPAVEGALAKVERVLPAALREQVLAVQETLALDISAEVVAPPGEMVVMLSTAARQRQRVQLQYQAYNGRITDRPFDPYGLVYRAGYWYAVGHCHLRAGLRTFRLDRVLAAQLAAESFERPADFDPIAHVNQSLAATPGVWLVEALIAAPLDEVRQCVPPGLATLEQTAAGVMLRCYVQRLGWIAQFLAWLGLPLVVQQPPELRAELRRLAASVAALGAEPD